MERCYKGLKENAAYSALEIPPKQTGKSDQNPGGVMNDSVFEASAMKISECGSNLAIGFSTGQARMHYLREDWKFSKEFSWNFFR